MKHRSPMCASNKHDTCAGLAHIKSDVDSRLCECPCHRSRYNLANRFDKARVVGPSGVREEAPEGAAVQGVSFGTAEQED